MYIEIEHRKLGHTFSSAARVNEQTFSQYFFLINLIAQLNFV